jgi:hypothetical protein
VLLLLLLQQQQGGHAQLKALQSMARQQALLLQWVLQWQ